MRKRQRTPWSQSSPFLPNNNFRSCLLLSMIIIDNDMFRPDPDKWGSCLQLLVLTKKDHVSLALSIDRDLLLSSWYIIAFPFNQGMGPWWKPTAAPAAPHHAHCLVQIGNDVANWLQTILRTQPTSAAQSLVMFLFAWFCAPCKIRFVALLWTEYNSHDESLYPRQLDTPGTMVSKRMSSLDGWIGWWTWN